MDWAVLFPFVRFSAFGFFAALFSAILRPDKKHRMLMIKITMMKEDTDHTRPPPLLLVTMTELNDRQHHGAHERRRSTALADI